MTKNNGPEMTPVMWTSPNKLINIVIVPRIPRSKIFINEEKRLSLVAEKEFKAYISTPRFNAEATIICQAYSRGDTFYFLNEALEKIYNKKPLDILVELELKKLSEMLEKHVEFNDIETIKTTIRRSFLCETKEVIIHQ